MTEIKKVAEDAFGGLTVPQILVAVLDFLGPITLPVDKFLNLVKSDREVEVAYSDDYKTFTFSVRSIDAPPGSEELPLDES